MDTWDVPHRVYTLLVTTLRVNESLWMHRGLSQISFLKLGLGYEVTFGTIDRLIYELLNPAEDCEEKSKYTSAKASRGSDSCLDCDVGFIVGRCFPIMSTNLSVVASVLHTFTAEGSTIDQINE